MKKIQRVLVVVDSESSHSNTDSAYPIELDKALRLVVDKESTELHLFSVAYQKHLHHDSLSWDFDQEQKRQEYCDQVSKNLEHLSDRLQSDGYKCSSDVVWAHPRYHAVISKAKTISADLIIQHTRSYGKIEFHHLTNDSWELVRHCSFPLLLVKNEPWKESPTMIAAVDPVCSHLKPVALDKQILDAAQTMQSHLGEELHIVHAYAEAARPFVPAGIIESEHRAALDELLASFPIADEKLHFMDATAINALQMKIRELKADILIMGAMSRSRLSEMLIGSTAEKVLDFLETDVLIITPEAGNSGPD